MQVSEHGVTVPSTQHSNGVVVDSAAHERYGAAGAEGTGADVRIPEARFVSRIDGDEANGGGDIRFLDEDSLAIMEIRCNGSGGCGFVLTEVKDAADDGFDGAGERIRAGAMCDDFTFRSILLCCEGERDKSGSVEVVVGALDWVDGPVVDVKLHVSETKGGVIRSGTRVLTRSKEEVEGKGDDISDGLAILSGGLIVCLVKDEDEDNDGDWFYTGGGCLPCGSIEIDMIYGSQFHRRHIS
jgi:hypothetical protein